MDKSPIEIAIVRILKMSVSVEDMTEDSWRMEGES
jgi:hypothetical protein